MADTTVKVSFIGDAKKLSKTIDGIDKDLGGLGTSSKSFTTKFSDGFNKITGGLQKALPVIAGVGAGVAVLGSALKAAVEDEAEQKRLAETLKAVAGATDEQIKSTEKWIDVTQRATGVADSELRPAFDVLIRSSKGLEDAQKNLAIAMDVAQGTGKDLDTVAQALAKVLEGNTGAATRLVPELTGIAREGASADEVMASLAETFKGQTAVHAETLQGKLSRVNIAFDEMKEKLGEKLMPLVVQFSDWMLKTGIPKIEETAAKVEEWWAQQDELKESLIASGESLKQFGEQTVVMTKYAIQLFGAMKPLVELMVEFQKLQNKINPLNLLSGGGTSVEDLAAERENVGQGTGGALGFATGGVVPGPRGMPQWAVVHGGERVLTEAQQRDGFGGASPTFVFNGPVVADRPTLERIVWEAWTAAQRRGWN